MGECIFCKIIKKEISVQPVYEDEYSIVIKDINPQAPSHLLAIPKAHYTAIHLIPESEDNLLYNLFKAIKKVVSEQGLDKKGYRLVINSGSTAGQSVDHLHVHILSGRQFHWPPG
ncbi:MAG: histidine triad nucleotide-binding protein [Chitinispirillaceae bacterium]|nr:histidine triad nucleotide-binding protein [Chitinispirillaceae bacterium]